MRIRTLALGVMLSLAAAVAAQDAAKVESFSPQGQIKDVRQVVARFSQPMVSFGDPRSEAPFDIECPAIGAGPTHSPEVVDDGPTRATGCTTSIRICRPGSNAASRRRPGLKTFAGAEVTAQTFRFSTGGPSIRGAWPDEGEERIDEAQVFMLALDAHADLASVRANAYCAVDGIGERLPLNDHRRQGARAHSGRAEKSRARLVRRYLQARQSWCGLASRTFA